MDWGMYLRFLRSFWLNVSKFRRTGVLCTTLLVSIFWGCAAQLDPLGVKSAADLHSEALFQRLISGPWYQSTAQNKITVVLIDDAYLQQIDEHWPMSFTQQDLLLSDILDYKPQLVFLDFLYMYDHGDEDELQQYAQTIRRSNRCDIQELQHAHAAGRQPDNIDNECGKKHRPTSVIVPYLIKNDDTYDACAAEAPTDLAKSAKSIEVFRLVDEIAEAVGKESYIGWSGCGSRYPSLIRADEDYPTPGFALFKASCDHTSYAGEGCKALQKDGPSAFTDPMAINWGVGVSQAYKEVLKNTDSTCTSFTKDSFSERFDHLLTQIGEMFSFSQMLSSRTDRGIPELCTYTDTVNASWFLSHSPDNINYLRKMLEGRIVLVGAKVEGIHDYVNSPVNGKVPGVYLFAMALDNYFEYGSNYFKEMSDLESAVMEIIALFILTLFIKFLWFCTGSRFSNTNPPQGLFITSLKSVFAVLIYKIALPIVISFSFAFALWKFSYAPMDWIGVSLLSFIANPVSLKECMNGKSLSNPCSLIKKFHKGSSSCNV